jgi:hypothetical protein
MSVADLVRFSRIPTNGMNSMLRTPGQLTDQSCFLLHGFPEFWYAWRKQQCRVTCPTLVIWGMRDAYGVPELADASVRLCQDGPRSLMPHTGHNMTNRKRLGGCWLTSCWLDLLTVGLFRKFFRQAFVHEPRTREGFSPAACFIQESQSTV